MHMSKPTPRICSLDEYQVSVTEELRFHLSSQYEALYEGEDDACAAASRHFERILTAMKTPPSVTTCRINNIMCNQDEAVTGLQEALIMWATQHSLPRSGTCQRQRAVTIAPHTHFKDLICVSSAQVNADLPSQNLFKRRTPLSGSSSTKVTYASWKSREEAGWPMTHRVIICDRLCGEAVLRGSDIFVRGVICADSGIERDEDVAVYADMMVGTKVRRGMKLDQYSGTCVFLGLGMTSCARAEMFKLSKGVAVRMSSRREDRAGPPLPPLHGVLPEKMILQNLPSVLVAHALAPQQGELVLDMCCAPGGKTSHIASLVHNNATVVACDKSRRKMVAAKALFQRMGASCITPLVLDTTSCVLRESSDSWKSVSEVLSTTSTPCEDGLSVVEGFYPESFDRILLDPPCSALGLRPKLKIEEGSWKSIEKHSNYQKRFVREAVSLLKQGGTLTYSTCTINTLENEEMVRHILGEYPCMNLLPIEFDVGLPGLPGAGLDGVERTMVRRFDPSDEAADTMGFFVAKFRKT